MTLLRDASSPAAVKSDPSSVSTLTTAAFTPPVGALLVMAGILDTSTASRTILSSTPTGSTSAWTVVESWGVSGHGVAAISTATVVGSVSTTARATLSQSSDAAMSVGVYTGANGVGSHGHATITANPTTISYTPTVVGSIFVVAVEDYEGQAVLISGSTLEVALTSASNGKISRQTTPAASLSPQSFSVSGSAGSQALVWAEILPAGAAGPQTGGTLDMTAVFAGSVLVGNTAKPVGALTMTATVAGSLVIGYPNLVGTPAVVVSIVNPPVVGGAAETVSNDLDRTSADGTTVRVATGLPPNGVFVDMFAGAGPTTYIARAIAASGATADSA